MSGTGMQGRNWVLAAMIFAVSMTFIDQTIVSIAVPNIQRELGLTSTGVQWVVNGYLIALAALFALGGRLSDIFGHTKMCVIGVIVFVAASTLCGLTPTGSIAEAWIVTFRVIQGAGGALMFPAALAIVVNVFPLRERGRALALFFGIAGGLTAIGPILGGYLTQWTWRAIFWVEHPRRPHRAGPHRRVEAEDPVQAGPDRLPGRGAHRRRHRAQHLRPAAVRPLGLEQSVDVDLHHRRDPHSGRLRPGRAPHGIAADSGRHLPRPRLHGRKRGAPDRHDGLHPRLLLRQRVRADRAAKSASEAGLFLLYFFIGFVIAAQIGGRMLDREGAKRAVVLGCAIAAVGFGFWASKATILSFSKQEIWVIVAGAGMGMMLGPANTDAVNRAGSLSYGEATGITQTIRNYGASLGLAALGTILLTIYRSHLTTTLEAPKYHLTNAQAAAKASQITQGQQSRGSVTSIPHFVSLDFAHATQGVLYTMCGIMAFAGSWRCSACDGAARSWRPSKTAPFPHPPPEADLRSWARVLAAVRAALTLP